MAAPSRSIKVRAALAGTELPPPCSVPAATAIPSAERRDYCRPVAPPTASEAGIIAVEP